MDHDELLEYAQYYIESTDCELYYDLDFYESIFSEEEIRRLDKYRYLAREMRKREKMLRRLFRRGYIY